MLVGQKVIIAALRSSHGTIKAWMAREEDPLPVIRGGKRGIPHQYDLGLCTEWHERQEIAKVTGVGKVLDYTAERAKLAEAQRIKIELETDILRGNVILRDVVVSEYGSLVVNFTNKMQSLAAKLAPILVTMTEPEIEGCLDDNIRDACDELSVERTMQTREGSSEAEGQRVGRRKPPAQQRSERGTRALEH